MRRELTVFQAARGALKVRAPAGLSMVDQGNRGWHMLWSGGGEVEPGDFQKDIHLPPSQALANFAVWACITQIAGDLSKLCVGLREHIEDDKIWLPTYDVRIPWLTGFLAKPNHFQTMQQFVESWALSKQTFGNTLALKERDGRGVVVRQYVLDWSRVTPLVAPDGSVFYELRTDDLSHIHATHVAVPASEVIHDRFNTLFHPLVGVSPLFSANLPALQGLKIQQNASKFFANMSRPSGIVTAPAKIADETAERIKRDWENNYRAGNIGKVAVLGDGLKYESMAVTPENSQLVEQLKLTAEQVCSAFHVPPFMVGIGTMPGFENVQALKQWYYDTCLQKQIEAFEGLQDEGLALPRGKYRVQFDLDDLLRMDSKTLAEVEGTKVQRAISAPNESRRKFDLPPVEGGESPMAQQQNFALSALAKRDASADPFAATKPAAPAPTPPEDQAAAAERAAAAVLAAVRPLLDSVASAQVEQQRQVAALQAQRDAEQQAAAVIDAFERRIAQALG
jgi:HK97 family phage portal protein